MTTIDGHQLSCPACDGRGVLVLEPLTFGELAVNERFIVFPADGTLRSGRAVFTKLLGREARRASDHAITNIPNETQVLKL